MQDAQNKGQEIYTEMYITLQYSTCYGQIYFSDINITYTDQS